MHYAELAEAACRHLTFVQNKNDAFTMGDYIYLYSSHLFNCIVISALILQVPDYDFQKASPQVFFHERFQRLLDRKHQILATRQLYQQHVSYETCTKTSSLR